ncbi:Anaphase-promoting complex subunit 10 [Podila horticola]|nr:Anaphase-promoting complex subunit 10 [Podila horticola]
MPTELDSKDKLDIGKQAVWSVSSAKFGHPLELLRDNNLETFWHKLDESYTPQRISVRGGTDFHDLKELVMLELEDLSGWTNIKLEDSPGSGKAPQMFLLQFAVLLNQQSGKDTHIRQLKIFSTKEPALIQDEQIPFEDPKFMQFANIR